MLTSSEMPVVPRESELRLLRKRIVCDPWAYPPVPCRKDSIRSLVISQRLLGTREIAVFHHTDCGMQTFTTAQLREKLKASTEAGDAEKVAAAADTIQFLEFSDLDKAVEEEVEYVKAHPLILKETEVTGWVYHVESGKVRYQIIVFLPAADFVNLCGQVRRVV